MIRNILLSTVLAVSAGSAFAADLPARVAAPAPYIAAPMFTWTGFYVGLNAGASFNNHGAGYGYNGYGVGGLPAAGAPYSIYGLNNGSSSNAGFTGGAQAGYNMQFGSFVAGVETDINYIDRNKGNNGVIAGTYYGAAPYANNTYYTVNRGNGSNYFGTVRGRLGYAFDRALIYVTGGLAYGAKSGTGTVYSQTVGAGAPYALSTPVLVTGTGGNSNSIGWTLGGGLEYAFSNAWSVKAEYLHVDLGRNSRTFVTATGPATTFTLRNENKFDVVRAGLNYRF
ncbi:MAG: porin family protein [Hyphomicrobiales bacterium]|nr:porin family protein [Hyphomicrobiales bacterium]